jgi:hypothetical protein
MADRSDWVEHQAVSASTAPLSENALKQIIEELEYVGDVESSHRYITQLAILQAGETTLETLEQ